MNEKQNILHIRLPPKIIKQIGPALYGSFIPAICEAISNSYDADATEMIIRFNGTEEISIEDNGIGMSWDTLKNHFFEAGINRRTRENQGRTDKGRLVTGKKGLGKFALFGLCEEIEIETCDGEYTNIFSINIKEIEKSNGTEFPLIPTKYNEPSTNRKSYTRIKLKKLFKKYYRSDLIDSLARRINYFFKTEDDEFAIKIIGDKGEEHLLDKEKRYEIIKKDMRIIYEIPGSLSTISEKEKIKIDQSDINTLKEYHIKGFLLAKNKTTTLEGQKGVAIFSRGKICQDPSYFDIQQSNSYGYAHLYGELEIDFLDEDIEVDYIATNRKEVEWDRNEKLEKLRNVITTLLKRYAEAYDNDKKRLEEEQIKLRAKELDIDEEWFERFPYLDNKARKQLRFFTKTMLSNANKQNKELVKDIVGIWEKNVRESTLFLNIEYIDEVFKKFKEIKTFYVNALNALATNDIETAIIKANTIREEALKHIEGKMSYNFFKEAIKQYTSAFERQEVANSIKALLNPLQNFSQDKNSIIEQLRSSTQTAHNTDKNPQPLNDRYLAELVLNYVFMYAGFVLRKRDLFLQSPDSSSEEQRSQFDEQ